MKHKKSHYWQSAVKIPDVNTKTNEAKDMYEGDVPVEAILSEASSNAKGINRREFIKTLGFSTAAVSLAACNRAPVRKAVSFFTKPEQITPGIPTYYATYCPDGYSVLVKTVEGRPIKIEGNPDCPIANGAVGVQGQASVLSLYDNYQLKQPLLKDFDSNWESIDNYVIDALKNIALSGKEITLVSNTLTGPSTKAIIDRFVSHFPSAQHVVYDNISYSGMQSANQEYFGISEIPCYHFDKADYIVSFGADFLNTWLDPIRFTKQYSLRRNSATISKMSKHVQFESIMSLTGSNADIRVPIKPSEEFKLLEYLYIQISKQSGLNFVKVEIPKKYRNAILDTARTLLATKGNSVVVSGSNDTKVQLLVNNINYLLGNYGTTIDFSTPLLRYKGDEVDFASFIKRAGQGKVGAVLFIDNNPVYTFKKILDVQSALKKIELKIALTDRLTETSSLCDVVAITPNFLTSWGDAEPYKGTYMLQQPSISSIYNTRSFQESLLKWAGVSTNHYEYLKTYWEENILKVNANIVEGKVIWQKAVRNGFYLSSVRNEKDITALKSVSVQRPPMDIETVQGNIELVLYQSTGIRDGAGSEANNPMLQELPDPLTKVTWDNYVSISNRFAKELGLKEEEVVTIYNDNYCIDLPICIQPGQAHGTIGIALGYGRKYVGKAGSHVGKNAYPFLKFLKGHLLYNNEIKLKKVGTIHHLAKTQTELSYHDRDIIRETVLEKYKKNPSAGNTSRVNLASLSKKDAQGQPIVNNQGRPELNSMWDEHERKGLHWGMAIDLNLCTGCSACIISCNLENNIAVVGPDEVRKRRDMHWLRIDRYYSDISKNDRGFIIGEENVSVVHQPMLCQHCDHAPCETVCPVLATMHSAEGLNQMVYNRCFGTRYCANNCPYKVRRFNWFNYADNDKFDYHMNNDLGKLVLNPEVTVRSRGVMEKCSMCVQRIQAGKLKAKLENRPVKDGDIETACSQSCPTQAITFGNINDTKSRVHKLLHNPRTYYVLEELNVQPGIGYLTMIRNKNN